MYFSRQEPNPGIVANTVAFPLQSTLSTVLGQIWAHEQKIRRSGHARGKRGSRCQWIKGNWIGGVKNSCER